MRKKDTTKIVSLGVAAVVIATGLLWLWQGQKTVEPGPTPPIVIPIKKPPAAPPSIGEGPSPNQPQPVYPPDVVEITPPPPAPPSVGEEPSSNQPQPIYSVEDKQIKPKPVTEKPKPVAKKPCWKVKKCKPCPVRSTEKKNPYYPENF